MKKLIIILSIMIGPLALAGNTAKISVSGMVCSFCSSKIKKDFEKRSEVEKIEVFLDENLDDEKNDSYVSLSFNKGKDISNDEIKSLIEKNGFKVENIERK